MESRPTGGTVAIDNLGKAFATPTGSLVALTAISLRIVPGEFVVVVGPSGCGKSTLLRIVAGLEAPTEGVVEVDSKKVLGPSEQHGVVFQRPALFPWLNVIDNVTFGPRMRGRGRDRTLKSDASRYLAAVGLAGFDHAHVYELSGGMQHRVALARVLINRPELLLMDEPFGALDAQTRLVMQELLVSIWTEDRSTTLFITHDVDEALVLADRVVVMTARPGRIKAVFDVALPRPRDLSVITSSAFADLKRDIVRLIREELPPVELLPIGMGERSQPT